jgi:predicted kinase
VPKVIILKGLPGSGKSTWAKEVVLSYPNTYKRVNKDDLRSMLDGGQYSKANEKVVLQTRDLLISNFLKGGFNVIVDDTNLAPHHIQKIMSIAKEAGVSFEIKEFDVSVEECIARDLKRPNPVGEKVIRGMYKQFVKPTVDIEPLAQNINLPKAIIVDIDGTVAKMVERGPYDWDKVSTDAPIREIVDLVNDYCKMSNTQPLFVSGRDGICFDDTVEWLKKYVTPSPMLFMRPTGSKGKDAIVKRVIFDNEIFGKYYVRFVLDDRDQVVAMWRGLGLRCLQVAYGDF